VASRTLILAAALFAVGAGVAGAIAPHWNSGYNGWWPAGFGFPPVTKQASDFPCSVSAYGPTFHVKGGSWTQDYGGGTSCASALGGVSKTLTISDQVLAPNGHSWVTLGGSTFDASTNGNPVHAKGNRDAVLGHSYRAVATAKLVVPNGHAGCSLTNTCFETITLTAISRPLAP
jgi:hypothetical protein